MNTPLDPMVADMVHLLDDNHREEFEERAAIIEFDAGLPRGHAECLALLDVLRRHPAVLTGVSLIQVEVDLWLLTTDPDIARQHLGDIHEGDLAEVINEQYGGKAMLSRVAR